MAEAHKHVKGTYSVDTPYIKLEDTGNRGHEFKFKKERTAKALRSQHLFLAIKQYLASATRRGHPQHKQL